MSALLKETIPTVECNSLSKTLSETKFMKEFARIAVDVFISDGIARDLAGLTDTDPKDKIFGLLIRNRLICYPSKQ